MSDQTTQAIVAMNQAVQAMIDATAAQGQQLAVATANAADLQSQLDAANAKIQSLLSPPTPVNPPAGPPVVNPPSPPVPPAGPFGVDVRQAGLTSLFDGRPCLPDDQRTQYTWTWDFGDGQTGIGFAVNHAYEQPGNYTATLTIGNLPPIKRTFSVAASTRKIVAVGPGDIAKILVGDNVEFNLAPGVYACSATVQLGKNVVIRGGDRKATVNGVVPVDMIVLNTDTRVDGVVFDYPAAAGYRGTDYGPVAVAIYGQGSGNAVTNCTFLNVADAFNGNRGPTGVLFSGNVCPLVDGIPGYMCWVQGSLWMICGNKFANSRINHAIRVEANAIGGSVYRNILANVAQAQSGVPGDTSKSCWECHYGADWYVAANDITGQSVNGGGDCAFGPLRLDAMPGNPERVLRCVCENNTFHGANCGVDAGAIDVVIRQNVFKSDQAWPVNSAIVVHATDTARGRDVENVIISGNTADAAYKRLSIMDGSVVGLVSDWIAS